MTDETRQNPSKALSHASKLTALQRRALEAINLHRGFRRTELTATEKRTTTALLKRGMVERDSTFYVITAAGAKQLSTSHQPAKDT